MLAQPAGASAGIAEQDLENDGGDDSEPAVHSGSLIQGQPSLGQALPSCKPFKGGGSARPRVAVRYAFLDWAAHKPSE